MPYQHRDGRVYPASTARDPKGSELAAGPGSTNVTIRFSFLRKAGNAPLCRYIVGRLTTPVGLHQVMPGLALVV